MDHRTAARNEALAALILNHLASNTAAISRRGSRRGRNSTRGRGRSVSFSNCACAGPTCTSRPQQPGNSVLDAHARTLSPAGGQRGRHTARQSKPLIRPASSGNLCHPTIARGATPPVFPLFPPSAFAPPAGPGGPEVRAYRTPQSRFPSCDLVPSPPASPPPAYSPGPPPLKPAPRGPSPVLEPGSGVERIRRIETKFQFHVNDRFASKICFVEKKLEYNCSCQAPKNFCTCSKATLEVNLKLRYRLTDPLVQRSGSQTPEPED